MPYTNIVRKTPMTIDLSQFVDKEVIITLNSGKVIETTLRNQKDIQYPYWCVYYNEEGYATKQHFTKDGIYDFDYDPEIIYDGSHDIKSIRLKTHTNPMNSTELPESTIEKLAWVLSPDAIKYITGTEEYITFMTEMITKFVKERVGNLNPDVECEIVTNMVSGNIDLRIVK